MRTSNVEELYPNGDGWKIAKQREICDIILRIGACRTPIQKAFVEKCKKTQKPLQQECALILKELLESCEERSKSDE